MRRRPPVFDVTIIGGGPAGLAAGTYLARAGWRSALFEKDILGGQARRIEWIENYPGFPQGVSGEKLMSLFATQAERWRLKTINAAVIRVDKHREYFEVVTDRNVSYECRSVIDCSGTSFRNLRLPGEAKLLENGIYHCAFDVAHRFSGKCAAVVGGGETAIHEALLLAGRANKVYLIHRGARLKAIRLLQKRFRSRSNIEALFHTTIKGAYREAGTARGLLAGIEISDLGTGLSRCLPVDGLFVLIGKELNTGLTQWRKPPLGYFTAGDAAGGFRQVAIASGDGIRSAMECERYFAESLRHSI